MSESEQAYREWKRQHPAGLPHEAWEAACVWQQERYAELARALFKPPHGVNSSFLEIVGNGIAEAIMKAT